MRSQKGFTLIELMVVIVIIGILSALAIPKMFNVSAKAKIAEAPQIIANYETLQSAYYQENNALGTAAQIGFTLPTSMWFTYSTPATGTVRAGVTTAFGPCTTSDFFQSAYVGASDSTVHTTNNSATCRVATF